MTYCEWSLDELDKAVQDGLITRRTHPQKKWLSIFNYTKECAYERQWNELTMACRGLIVDESDATVRGRGFKKFFNLEELEIMGHPIPYGEDFDVFEKMDGSLGISYIAPDGLAAIATRGSFESEQAIWATNWLRSSVARERMIRGSLIDTGICPLFEIIYPENRIVLDYKDTEHESTLCLIGAVTFNGDEHYLTTIAHQQWIDAGGSSPEQIEVDSLQELRRVCQDPEVKGDEGYVIRWKSGLRAKLKYADYIRLHRITFGLSTKYLWEQCFAGKTRDQILVDIPEEFHSWCDIVLGVLQDAFDRIVEICLSDYKEMIATLGDDASRKEQAEFILQREYPSILFKILDGKPEGETIWRLVKPSQTTFFMQEDEDV